MSRWYDDEFEDDHYTLGDYETPADAIVIEGPIYAVSKRGPIGKAWWGQQWVLAMEYLGLSGRLDRGRTYARNGSVRRLEIGYGLAFALVQGSHSRPYRTAVHIKPLTPQEWESALTALSEQAIYAAKLLAGEMPGDIETIFQGIGLSLFPKNLSHISFECSCPDWGDPCKHAAAVYYLLAEQLDADPFVLFHLRGRSQDSVLSTLRATWSDEEEPIEAAPDTSLDSDLEGFWRGAITNLVPMLPRHHSEPFALRQLGSPPGSIEKELRQIYAQIAHTASSWLGLDE